MRERQHGERMSGRCIENEREREREGGDARHTHKHKYTVRHTVSERDEKGMPSVCSNSNSIEMWFPWLLEKSI